MMPLALPAARSACFDHAMPGIYGPRRSFATRAAAENFLRHVTRELTAGGLPHWLEAREAAPNRWLAFVHQFDCEGGAGCKCDAD
jgi:hypothetical protein